MMVRSGTHGCKAAQAGQPNAGAAAQALQALGICLGSKRLYILYLYNHWYKIVTNVQSLNLYNLYNLDDKDLQDTENI